jgi:hypothetical protein
LGDELFLLKNASNGQPDKRKSFGNPVAIISTEDVAEEPSQDENILLMKAIKALFGHALAGDHIKWR